MSLYELARHLSGARTVVMERWQAAVYRDQVPSAREIPKPLLWDHLPAVMEEIVLAVEGRPTPGVEADGEEHGRQRWAVGYEITEVLRELSVFRDVLHEVVAEYAGGAPGLTNEDERAAGLRVRGILDRSSEAAVGQYHAETLAVRHMLEEELRVSGDQKDRFLAMLSHELRNPLAPILTAVQLLEVGDPSGAHIRRAREIIERQVRHQARLVDDLLDLNRVSRGKIALHLGSTDLNAAAQHALERCRGGITAKQQEITLDLPADTVWVHADPVRLEQIVSNLLINANRYTTRGGRIWLTVVQEGEAVVLSVRDNGQGIAPEMLPRIFDLFVQADLSTGRSEEGLGIGLTLVRHLVELHGGKIHVRSDGVGEGSEFVVRLPSASPGEVDAPSRSVAERIAGVRRRILIVEDSEDNRAVLAELLELIGHTVATATSGSEALQRVVGDPPDSLIVDIGLPEMDGYELARRLRQTPSTKDALLIALSGYGSADDIQRAIEAGFDAHLTKPADIGDILRLLDEER